ncbi:hypothetical protein I7I51_08218 [Histoplasma capsulatum]|uniref:Uncharacterized protein n=1 Tax=Ajellomyces capsulatus TaxID=5037 RepID=A0A8A1LY17_AJECA|nr:hypothetical protein I7I51_08218 [Histoplasma capsulatum]
MKSSVGVLFALALSLAPFRCSNHSAARIHQALLHSYNYSSADNLPGDDMHRHAMHQHYDLHHSVSNPLMLGDSHDNPIPAMSHHLPNRVLYVHVLRDAAYLPSLKFIGQHLLGTDGPRIRA